MSQQGVGFGFAASEIFEHLHGMTAASQSQHGLAKPPTGLNHGVIIVQARFLKRAERIRAQHFRPLITIVPRSVAAGENVLKSAQTSIFGKRLQQRRDLGNPPGDFLVAFRSIGVVLVVQSQIGHAEVQLP